MISLFFSGIMCLKTKKPGNRESENSYQALGFADEAECVMHGDELIIRPVRTVSGGEFAEQILAELIAKGLTGEALLSEFKDKQAQIRPAVEAMLADAEDAAEGKGDFAAYDDVFGRRD